MTEHVRNWADVVDPTLQNNILEFQEATPAEEVTVLPKIEKQIAALILDGQVDISGIPSTIHWGNFRKQEVRDNTVAKIWHRNRDLKDDLVTLLGGTIIGMRQSRLYVSAATPTELRNISSSQNKPIRTWGFDLDGIMLIDRSQVQSGHQEAAVSDVVYTKPLNRLELYRREIATNSFLFDNPFGPIFSGYGYGRRC